MRRSTTIAFIQRPQSNPHIGWQYRSKQYSSILLQAHTTQDSFSDGSDLHPTYLDPMRRHAEETASDLSSHL